MKDRRIGQTVSHYRLTSLLGAGGMGTVYKADDLKLQRNAAVKIVTPHHSDSKTEIKRFMREARAVSKIGHPNVITVYDIVEQDGVNFFIMEYVDGPSLRTRMSDPIELPEVIRIAREVASGLDAAHSVGVVHRDVKPENIMMTKSGLCKVLDFGLAQLVNTTVITTEGRVVGTLSYMAPEQLQGQATDGRTDVYSLGVVLYEMLAGRRPFDASAWEALRYQIVAEEPPELRRFAPEVPGDVAAIVHQAIEKDPANRYESMSAMLHDLEFVQEQLSGRVAEGKRLHARRKKRHRMLTWAAAATSLAILASVWRGFFPPSDTNPKILVMRANNSLAEESIDYLSGGIMDGLITALSQLKHYDVIARETVATTIEATELKAAGFAPASLVDAAGRIQAEYVVIPSFAEKDQTIRVDCELRKVGRDSPLGSWWQDVGDLRTDFYPAIGHLASDIAFALGAEWPEEGERENVVLTRSMEALEHYQRGVEYFEEGRAAEALAEMRLAVEADTTFSTAYYRLARLSPDSEEQENALLRAMIYRHSAPQPMGRLILASQLEWDDQVDDAIDTFRSVLVDYPTNVEARRSLAKLLMYVRRFPEAAAEFAALKTVNPLDYSFYDFWWIAYSGSGRPDKALSVIEEWRREKPNEPAPLCRIVSHHLTFGDYDAIEPILTALAELDPGKELRYRASVYATLGRVKDGEGLYESLLRSENGSARVRREFAQFYYTVGEYEKGLMQIQQALDANPDYYTSWIAGLLAAANGQPDVARAYLPAIKEYFTEMENESEVVEAVGQRRFYYNLSGEIALAEGDLPKAVEMHKTVIRFSSYNDRPFFGTYLGKAYLASGNYDNAVKEFETVLSINPDYPPALLYLGKAHIEHNQHEKGKEVLFRLERVWRQADDDYAPHQELKRLLTLAGE